MLVGERRALSAITLAFFGLIFLLLALAPEAAPLRKSFLAVTGVYGLAFFSLVAGYFWARWFSVGVGLFGLIIAALLTWTAGQLVWQFTFLGVSHLAVIVMLWGSSMSEAYDGKTAWRERFHMDENAVQRLGRSVIRAGMSLPLVLMVGLAPRQGSELVLSLGAVVLTAVGLRATIKLRLWGVLALGTAGALMLALAGTALANGATDLALPRALAGSLLVFAATPWIRPVRRFFAAV